MDILYIVDMVTQYFAISLGVGSSTIAILNFFAAIKDGSIDAAERKMMGVTYVVLRVSMGLILITGITSAIIDYSNADINYWNPTNIAFWILVFALYANSVLMTKRIMPSTYGPSLQAATWYTLGVLASLNMIGVPPIDIRIFLFSYLLMFMLATSIVNGVMAMMKAKREQNKTT